MQTNGPAATPSVVRAALFTNVALVLAALIFPRMLATSHSDGSETETAAILFAIPMALVFAIGAFAAIRAYILARREDRPMSRFALAPLGVFVVGMTITALLIYTRII